MSQRVERNLEALKALARVNSTVQKAIISTANKDLVLALVECAINIIRGNVTLTKGQYTKLKRYHKHLRQLVRTKTSQRERRSILQTGGFLGALLRPLLGALLPNLLK